MKSRIDRAGLAHCGVQWLSVCSARVLHLRAGEMPGIRGIPDPTSTFLYSHCREAGEPENSLPTALCVRQCRHRGLWGVLTHSTYIALMVIIVAVMKNIPEPFVWGTYLILGCINRLHRFAVRFWLTFCR